MVEDKGQMLEESDSSHQCNILIKAKDTNKERVLGSSIGDPWYTCPKQSLRNGHKGRVARLALRKRDGGGVTSQTLIVSLTYLLPLLKAAWVAGMPPTISAIGFKVPPAAPRLDQGALGDPVLPLTVCHSHVGFPYFPVVLRTKLFSYP